jgi:hypothetical protein
LFSWGKESDTVRSPPLVLALLRELRRPSARPFYNFLQSFATA